MSDSPSAPSFRDLMESSAANIPDKKTVGAGRYKFRCTFSKYEEDHAFRDGSTGFQFSLLLQPVLNLDEPADDLANAQPVRANWTNRSPDFTMDELAEFIKAHNFTCPFKDAVPELKGKFYTGSVQIREGNVNIRRLLPAD
jgi:hypothetical protein